MYARLLVSAGLTLWLMLGAVGVQQQSADLFKGQVVQRRRADPEVQSQIDEAFKTLRSSLQSSRARLRRILTGG